MGQGIRTGVEVAVVLGFVDADSPENDRRMIPIAANHAENIVYRNILPRSVADVLPARYFFQDEKAKFVACIQEMPRLRIVRSAHHVAFEIVTKDLRIAPLHASRHGLAHKGEGLMAVEPAQLDDLAVQLEAVFGKPRIAE